MTVIVVVDVPVHPGERDAAIAALLLGLADTRAFDGNLGAEVLLDPEDEGHFLILERWADAADNERYQAWRLTPEGAVAGLGEHVSGPLAIRVHPIVG